MLGVGKIEYALAEFERINKAAYWNYQRETVHLKSKAGLSGLGVGGKILQPRGTKKPRPTKTIVSSPVATCPRGNGTSVRKRHRSEERRVGKECRSRWSPY